MASQVWSQANPSGSDVTSLAQELKGIAERATSFTKASGAAVFLIHGDHLVVAASTGGVINTGARIPTPGSFASRAVQSGRVVRCDDVEGDSTVDVRPFLPLRVRSMTAVPVGGLGRPVIGALVVVSDAPNCFNRTHMAILQTMADVVAEKCKTEDAFSAVLLAETEPRRSPLLDAHHIASSPAAERPVAPPSPSAIREVPVVLSAEAIPLAVRPEKPVIAKPIMTAPPRRAERVPTAYDRPRVTPSRSFNARPLVTICIAVVAVLGSSWAIRGHFAAKAEASSTPAQPIAATSAPATSAPAVAEPSPERAAAPVLPAKAEPQPERPAQEHMTASAARNETEYAPEPAAAREEAPAPAPTLHMPSSVALHDDSYVPAPKVALGAKTAAAPELLSAARALPQAPVSKLIPAHLTSRVAPEYPLLLRRFGKEGTVNLSLRIGPHGDVEQVEMISGSKEFLSAATNAVKQWRYEPAILDGRPVASTVEVSLRFSLPKK